jgi:hypothetical protein
VEQIGVDLGLRESQIATLTEAGEPVDTRIRTGSRLEVLARDVRF